MDPKTGAVKPRVCLYYWGNYVLSPSCQQEITLLKIYKTVGCHVFCFALIIVHLKHLKKIYLQYWQKWSMQHVHHFLSGMAICLTTKFVLIKILLEQMIFQQRSKSQFCNSRPFWIVMVIFRFRLFLDMTRATEFRVKGKGKVKGEQRIKQEFCSSRPSWISFFRPWSHYVNFYF